MGFWFWVIILLLGPFIARAFQEKAKKQADQQKAVEKEMAEYGGFTLDMAVKFYEACVGAGIANINSDAMRQKALLLAPQSKEEFRFAAQGDSYLRAYEAAEKQRQALLAAQLEEKRNAERAAEFKNRRLADLGGREKRLAMLQEGVEAAQALVDAVFAGLTAITAMNSAMQQKEKDWSVSAGLATGIAGPVAGMAVANDIAGKNAEIRARNAQISGMSAGHFNSGVNAYTEALFQRRRVREALEAAALKLYDESRPAASLMEELELGTPIIELTETGSVTISVAATLKDRLTLGEDMPAVVDGALCAHLFDEHGEEAGCAYLPATALGIDTRDPAHKPKHEEGRFGGICTTTKAGVDYTVKLEPYRLWLIER